MSDPEHYRQAALRESTARCYARVIEHFEGEWGGLLPASHASVGRYLAEHAEHFSPGTLRTHLAALAHWHLQHGFVDPTKAPAVLEVLRGIQALDTRPAVQAEPLQLRELEACIHALTREELSDQPVMRLRACRDRLLLLLGFWRALRSDELCRLRIEFIRLDPAKGLTLFLPSSKTDRANSGLSGGFLLRNVDRWGRLGKLRTSYSATSTERHLDPGRLDFDHRLLR